MNGFHRLYQTPPAFVKEFARLRPLCEVVHRRVGSDRLGWTRQSKKGGCDVRTILAVLVLGAAIVLNAATAFGATSDSRLFFGDGFDNTTCADLPGKQACR